VSKLSFADFTIREMPQGYDPGAFCCDDEPEIHDFLREDASADQDSWLSRTYVVEHGTECAGYFTVLADAVRLDLREAKEAGSIYAAAPAIKLARLGVCKRYRGNDLGSLALEYVAGLARSLSASIGVRYVTIDALNREKLIRWYLSKEFVANDGEEAHRSKKLGWFSRLKAKFLRPTDGVLSMRYDILRAPNGNTAETRVSRASATDIQ